MGEDAWLEAAYEDECAGFVGHSEDEDESWWVEDDDE